MLDEIKEMLQERCGDKGVEVVSRSSGIVEIRVDGQVAVDCYFDPWNPIRRPSLERKWRNGTAPHVRAHYGGNYLRSGNELRIATLLDAHGVKWRYEPKKVQLGSDVAYIPDFIVDPKSGWGPWLEVKEAKKVRLLAESFGMPPWHDEMPLDSYEVRNVRFDPELLSQDIAKPQLLSIHVSEDVWVLPGKTGFNQPYVVFHPDGTASASRQCPIFADTCKSDGAGVLARKLVEWPSLGVPMYTAPQVVRVIIDFLEDEGWVAA